MGWEDNCSADLIQALLHSEHLDLPLVSLLEGGLFRKRTSYPTFVLIHKVWLSLKKFKGHVAYTQHMPLWRNCTLTELVKLQDWEQ